MRKPDARRQLMLAKLNPIVEEALAVFGLDRYSVNQVAMKALPRARAICAEYLDDSTLDALLPIIRRHIPKHSRTATVQPRLRGFENIKLPTRIAVPAPGHEASETEESNDIMWVDLRRASIAEGQRNIDMRDAIRDGLLAERNLIYAVVEAARHAGGSDASIIGEVLRTP